MEQITSVIAFLNENAGTILAVFLAALGLAKVITKLTPSAKDDEVVAKVETVGGKVIITLEKLVNKDLNKDGTIG